MLRCDSEVRPRSRLFASSARSAPDSSIGANRRAPAAAHRKLSKLTRWPRRSRQTRQLPRFPPPLKTKDSPPRSACPLCPSGGFGPGHAPRLSETGPKVAKPTCPARHSSVSWNLPSPFRSRQEHRDPGFRQDDEGVLRVFAPLREPDCVGPRHPVGPTEQATLVQGPAAKLPPVIDHQRHLGPVLTRRDDDDIGAVRPLVDAAEQ